MSGAAIAVKGLGKRYRISHEREPYGRLSESLVNTLRMPFDRARGHRGVESEWFWALRDATFEVSTGEAVGVIGRNGAGKSTLLKILSRITEPSTGEATIRGRVASLLEVGTGFHPELTGRENIYLSGSILGMTRDEIVRRFDQIVEFAGVEQFLDTPVKRYSSGMQVRLGFAVAAHLEPEVLLVDEVLAVGDASFQAKCLGRLEEIGSEGRTVVFVSHSMPSIQRLCSHAILLDHGGVVAQGKTSDVVHEYLDAGFGQSHERRWDPPVDGPGDEVARLTQVRVVDATGQGRSEFDIRESFAVEVVYQSLDPRGLRPSVNLHFYNEVGICVFVSNDWNDHTWSRTTRSPGKVIARCEIPGDLLAEGRLYITAAVSTYDPTVVHALEHDAVSVSLVDRPSVGSTRGEYAGDWPGVVRPRLAWTVRQDSDSG